MNKAIHRSERTAEGWIRAELLRTKGELLLAEGGPGTVTVAEDHFRRACDTARKQEALSWELRAATSLARLLRDQDRSTESAAILRNAYGCFTEGFGTADLKAATALMD